MDYVNLFELSDQGLKDFGKKVIDMLVEIRGHSTAGLFAEKKSEAFLTEELDQLLPQNGQCPQEVLAVFQKEIAPLLFNSSQPKIGQLMASPIALLSFIDLITSFLNIQPYAQVNQHIEKLVVQWLSQMVGYRDDCSGILTNGGTISNLYALAVARVNKLNYDVRVSGYQQANLIVYTSEECHSSINKSVELLGIGSDNLSIVESDNHFRMRADCLEEAIQCDLANHRQPFCIVANLGNVRTGSVDPIAELAVIAQRYGLWLHLDGAYGAFGALCLERRELFKAVHLADSITIDPHKWLNVPIESSCLLVSDRKHLLNAFDHVPDYLGISPFDTSNPIRHNFELTKSDRALKTWFALKLFGVNKYRALVTSHIRYIEKFARKIKDQDDFQLLCEPELSICCFRYIPLRLVSEKEHCGFYLNNLNKAIETSLKTKEDFYVTSVKIKDVVMLRLCIINYRFEESFLELLIDLIRMNGQKLDTKMSAPHLESVTRF